MTKNIELWQGYIRRHLDRIMSAVPGILQVCHRVAETLYLHRAHLGVEWEVGEVHGTSRLKINIQLVNIRIRLFLSLKVTLMVSLMLLSTSPVCIILRNWFSVVA